MEIFKYMLHFYPYKHIAMNRFPSSQANFYHVNLFLASRLGDNNRAYAVCIHIELTTHFGTKRIGNFSFNSGLPNSHYQLKIYWMLSSRSVCW